ncbi:MAG: hypothetical protein ABIR16_02765, partial [Dokdonella sp.]
MSNYLFVQTCFVAATAPARAWRASLALMLATATPAWAMDIQVDVLNDPVPNGCLPGSCSLREAVSFANN